MGVLLDFHRSEMTGHQRGITAVHTVAKEPFGLEFDDLNGTGSIRMLRNVKNANFYIILNFHILKQNQSHRLKFQKELKKLMDSW